MSRGFNKSILLGNLARDPDVRHTQNKQKVARFTVAVGRQWKNKQTGETETQTDFIPIIAWAFLADLAENYLRKGKSVLVEGRMQVREYEDQKTGGRKWATEIVAEGITMLPGGKRDDDQQGQSRQQQNSYGRQDDNLPGQYGKDRDCGQDPDFEDDFPLDFSDLAGDYGDSRGEVDVPF